MDREHIEVSLNELETDLWNALEKIDFMEYDPYSREFMKALFIGQMWCVLCKLKCSDGSKSDEVAEELEGAEKYLADWKSTGDMQYKEMASDELKHAGILIKKHLAKTTDTEEKALLNKHEAERQKILSRINPV